MNILSSSFWGGSFWQGFSVIATLLSCVASPFLSTFVDRLVGKNDDAQDKHHRKRLNAYTALWQQDGAMGFVEFLFFLPIQLAAGYGLFLLEENILRWFVIDPSSLRIVCFAVVIIVTWGLAFGKRKSLAKLLTWQFLIACILYGAILLGDKNSAHLVTTDFTGVKHIVGQYLPAEVKQWPLVSSIRAWRWNTFPTDIHIVAPAIARTQFTLVYGFSLAFFLFCYTLYKRHHMKRLAAFLYLNEHERQEQRELVQYQEMQVSLEIKQLEKQEKEGDIDLKQQQTQYLVEREQLAVEKERLAVASARLDLEKKRAQYTIELATLLIDTLYTGGDTPEVRTELLRNTLPSLEEFGHRDKESTTLVLEHLQRTQQQPKVIAAKIA